MGSHDEASLSDRKSPPAHRHSASNLPICDDGIVETPKCRQTDTEKYKQILRREHRLKVRQVLKEKAWPTKLTVKQIVEDGWTEGGLQEELKRPEVRKRGLHRNKWRYVQTMRHTQTDTDRVSKLEMEAKMIKTEICPLA